MENLKLRNETNSVRVSTQFERLTNFRDIGGARTLDGRTMKSGLLFRSGELSRLSDNDLQTLRKLNLRVICDLRSPGERSRRMDRIPHSEGLRLLNIPMHQNLEFGRLKVVGFLVGESGESNFEAFIKSYYHRLAFEHTVQLKEIVTLISDEKNLPALIHCNAGKDRTGFVSAIIQLLAGVPRQAVLDDYLLTNRFYQPRAKRLLPYIRWLNLINISPDRLKLILEAHSDYLDDALDEILQAYGTIEDYLTQDCGVEEGSILNLKTLLVE